MVVALMITPINEENDKTLIFMFLFDVIVCLNAH